MISSLVTLSTTKVKVIELAGFFTESIPAEKQPLNCTGPKLLAKVTLICWDIQSVSHEIVLSVMASVIMAHKTDLSAMK